MQTMETKYAVAKAKHAEALRRYSQAILSGTTSEMTAALDVVDATHQVLRATPDPRLPFTTPLRGALLAFAEAA